MYMHMHECICMSKQVCVCVCVCAFNSQQCISLFILSLESHTKIWQEGFGILILQMRKLGLRGIKVPQVTQLEREEPVLEIHCICLPPPNYYSHCLTKTSPSRICQHVWTQTWCSSSIPHPGLWYKFPLNYVFQKPQTFLNLSLPIRIFVPPPSI